MCTFHQPDVPNMGKTVHKNCPCLIHTAPCTNIRESLWIYFSVYSARKLDQRLGIVPALRIGILGPTSHCEQLEESTAGGWRGFDTGQDTVWALTKGELIGVKEKQERSDRMSDMYSHICEAMTIDERYSYVVTSEKRWLGMSDIRCND